MMFIVKKKKKGKEYNIRFIRFKSLVGFILVLSTTVRKRLTSQTFTFGLIPH